MVLHLRAITGIIFSPKEGLLGQPLFSLPHMPSPAFLSSYTYRHMRMQLHCTLSSLLVRHRQLQSHPSIVVKKNKNNLRRFPHVFNLENYIMAGQHVWANFVCDQIIHPVGTQGSPMKQRAAHLTVIYMIICLQIG